MKDTDSKGSPGIRREQRSRAVVKVPKGAEDENSESSIEKKRKRIPDYAN